ncbi:MAG: type III secretion system stator protein SctL [bacterium]
MAGKILKKGDVKAKVGEQARTRPGAEMLPDSGGIVHRRVMDAGEEAAKILEKADGEAGRVRKEAEVVLAEARAKAAQEVKRGYAEGETKGLAQVTEKLMAVERLREEFYTNAESDVVNLVLDIAEKIVGRMVRENPEMIRSVVRQALERSLGDRITVRVNPEDYKSLMESDHDFREVLDRTKRLSFREDEAISKGGCIVETEVGTIDGQLETQMAAIKKALMA